ncbi:MAG TPA: PqqD family protein [Candidatus Bathyarchaeota archaeon]|nr:PqqD family protein [Candidatus Bathyarchaeota archaeon]
MPKKEGASLSTQRFMASIPVRNPDIKWEWRENNVILYIPIVKDKLMKFLEKLSKLPDYKRIKLDEISSRVWEKMDGKTTVKDIIRWLHEEYKLSEREAEISLRAYLKNLMDRNLVGLLVPLPKPKTSEAEVEIKLIEKDISRIEKLHKKKLIDDETYQKIISSHRRVIQYLRGELKLEEKRREAKTGLK